MWLVRSLCLLIALPLGPAAASSGLDGAERVTLHSKILGEERVMAVVTPASYARSKARYPVLYLTDGDAQIGHLRASAEFLARNGLMPEVILVGILNTARTRDLTPTRGTEGTDFPSAGGGERFLDFIERELIPSIDLTYRTLPLRIHAGHSFGGLLALHAVLTRPGLFQAVIAASPSLQWDDQLLLREASVLEEGEVRPPRAVFVAVGSREAPPGVLKLFEKFAEPMRRAPWKGYRWAWQVVPDEDHGSVVLPAYYAGLRHVFAGWAPRDEGVPPSLNAVLGHYQALSERWSCNFLPPEGMINLLGYRLLMRGDRAAAIETFRFNAGSHPESANVHDSLGEALEQDGQAAAALESYQRAVQIAEKTADPLLPPLREHLEHLQKRTSTPARPGNTL
jgi:predicted alpha/beta superfamily hydrolase